MYKFRLFDFTPSAVANDLANITSVTNYFTKIETQLYIYGYINIRSYRL